jgi:hypothetical protein
MAAPTRPFTRLVPVAALTALLVLSMVAAGCKEEKKLTPPPPPASDYLPASSAANVLANLKTAYETKNLAEYRKLFAEDFVFSFIPPGLSDLDNTLPPVDGWELADELTSTEIMFNDTSVGKIELHHWDIGTAEPAESLYYGPRAFRVVAGNVDLTVKILDTYEGLILSVEGSAERFYFREEPSRRASDGLPTWLIFRWEDFPAGRPKVERTSWGEIKAAFLPFANAIEHVPGEDTR